MSNRECSPPSEKRVKLENSSKFNFTREDASYVSNIIDSTGR